MNPLRSKGLTRMLFACAALALSQAGCAGYRLGSMLPPDIKSVAVPTFVNASKEPQVEVETTRAAIQEFQRDGSLQVLPEEQADSVLKVTIVAYQLAPVSYRREKRTAASEYRLTLLASLELVRKSDGAVIARNPRVKGESVFELAGDLSSAKLRALPEASEDLAHNIVEKVVEAW